MQSSRGTMLKDRWNVETYCEFPGGKMERTRWDPVNGSTIDNAPIQQPNILRSIVVSYDRLRHETGYLETWHFI